MPQVNVAAILNHRLAGLPERERKWVLIAEVGEQGTVASHPEISILRELLDDPFAAVWRQPAEGGRLEFVAIADKGRQTLGLEISVSEHQRLRSVFARNYFIQVSINNGIPFTLEAAV